MPDGGGVGDPLTTVHADAHPLATTADPSTMSGTDAETAGASGTGIERPVPEWVDLNQSLHRIVAFIDVCGFTRFTDQYGAHSAIEMLTRFRSACRDVTARRGTRVAKWMGDGVMLVGAEAGPVVATAAELLLRVEDEGFDMPAIRGLSSFLPIRWLPPGAAFLARRKAKTRRAPALRCFRAAATASTAASPRA